MYVCIQSNTYSVLSSSKGAECCWSVRVLIKTADCSAEGEEWCQQVRVFISKALVVLTFVCFHLPRIDE